MRHDAWLGIAVIVVGSLFLAGCPETEQPKTCSSVKAEFGYDAEGDRCLAIDSCGGGEGLEGRYETEAACRRDNGLAGADAGDVTGGDADDATTSDATDPDVRDGESGDTDLGMDTAADGGGDDAATDTTARLDTTADSSSGSDVGDTNATTMCSDQGKVACFSNYDCPQGERCEDISNTSAPLPCCVAGERGSKTVGEECSASGENSCESGVCIAKGSGPARCSDECQTVDDCPSNMKNCRPVFGSGSSQKWCFPT